MPHSQTTATGSADADTSVERQRAGQSTRSYALHPRMLIAAALVAVCMIPVGVLLSGLGVVVLKLAGGADTDTGLVTFVAAFAVTDFWGGGIAWSLTKAPRRDVTIAYTIMRLVILIVGAIISTRLAIVAPIQLIIAAPAVWFGVGMAQTQARLRATAARHEAEAVAASTATAPARSR